MKREYVVTLECSRMGGGVEYDVIADSGREAIVVAETSLALPSTEETPMGSRCPQRAPAQ